MATESNKLYQNNYGNKLQIHCGIDLTNYSDFTIKVKKPDLFPCPYCESESEELCEYCNGTGFTQIVEWVATKSEDNQYVEYIIQEGDLNQYGRYYLQVNIQNFSEESESEVEYINIDTETIMLNVYRSFE